MSEIDIHIILFGEPQWKVARCLASLSKEPVNIHFVEGIKEMPPWTSRAKGFATGEAPYVGQVDPDDEVLPGCYSKLLYAIESGDYDAAYGYEFAGEEWHVPNGAHRKGTVTRHPHHAFLLKRGLPVNYSGGFRVFEESPKERTICVPEVLYHWRRN